MISNEQEIETHRDIALDLYKHIDKVLVEWFEATSKENPSTPLVLACASALGRLYEHILLTVDHRFGPEVAEAVQMACKRGAFVAALRDGFIVSAPMERVKK